MKKTVYLLITLSLIIVMVPVFTTGCGNGSSPEPGFIFLITLDTTRADALDYSLSENTTTPNLAKLAAEGFYFENAYSLIPITLPSHYSMFYSQPPHQLKIYNNGQTGRTALPSMTQLLKGHGYDTGAVIALGVLKSDFGLNKGFDTYIENFKSYLWERTAEEVNSDLFQLIKKKNAADKKSFFWVHYADPHEPYFPPNEDGFFTISIKKSIKKDPKNISPKKNSPKNNSLKTSSSRTNSAKEISSQNNSSQNNSPENHSSNKSDSKAESKNDSKRQSKNQANVDKRNIVFTCKSTEYAAVKADFQLEPGKNRLVLETGMPSIFQSFPDCKVTYFKYREFELESKSPENSNKSAGIEIIPPVYWTSKKNDESIDYYSDRARSEVTIINGSSQPVNVTLRFYYSMHTDDATKKLFYREEVAQMDRQLGKLISFLKAENLYEKSVFVVMGDHGEGLGEYRGHFGHIHYLNKVFNHVPLIVAGAGIDRKGKRPEMVSNLHIAPTILDLAGISKPKHMLGSSLLKPLESKKILLETFSPEAYFDAFSLLDYPWQVVFYPGRREGKMEFYDLRQDSFGNKDLNRESANGENTAQPVLSEEAGKKKTELTNSILKISRIITATKGKVGKSTRRHQEILKSLGYL